MRASTTEAQPSPLSRVERRGHSPRRYLWALAGVTLVAALVRFPTLDLQSFWHDEAVTVNRVLHPSLWDTLSTLPGSESTPPLYYVLAWFWSKIFGTGEAGLRSLSALLGTATVPVAYAAASRLVSRRAGLVAAALVAVNPLLVWYSQEARAYALLVLLTAVSFLFFVRARDSWSGRDLAWWAVASALALASHYFAAFVVVPEAIWLLWTARIKRPAILATVGVGLAGAALLPLALKQSSSANNNWFSDFALSSRLTDVPKAFLAGPPRDQVGHALLVAGILAVAGLLLLAVRSQPDERRGALVSLVIGGAAVVVPLLMAVVGADFFIDRNLIAAVVPLTVAVAAGFASVRAGWVGLGAAALLVAVSVVMVVAVWRDPTFQRPDWREAAKQLRPEAGGRVVVTSFLGDDPLEVYIRGTKRLPRAGARVREVDVLAYSGASLRPPVRGFRVIGHRRIERFTLVRFRSRTPRLVRPARLRAVKLGAKRDAVLLIPAPRQTG
jgi:mannosyltransferase